MAVIAFSAAGGTDRVANLIASGALAAAEPKTAKVCSGRKENALFV